MLLDILVGGKAWERVCVGGEMKMCAANDRRKTQGGRAKVANDERVRGGEVERKLQRCRESDRCRRWSGKRRGGWFGGRGSSVSSTFGCRLGAGAVGAVGAREQSWVDEHGKAFTESGLPTPRTL